jgi:hypothetical protein
MNTSPAAGVIRTMGVALVLAAAIAAGLVVGNALDARQSAAGYPIGWQPGPGAPLARSADASFSIDALDAVRVARGDTATLQAPAEQIESDYHDRHPEITRSTRIPDFVE